MKSVHTNLVRVVAVTAEIWWHASVSVTVCLWFSFAELRDH